MMVLLMIEKGGAAMRTDERTRNKVDTVLRHTANTATSRTRQAVYPLENYLGASTLA
jgi:hypothetical protein